MARINLPSALDTLRLGPLMALELRVAAPLVVGDTPGGARRIGPVTGGTFEGERLTGKVLEGGADWQGLRADGAWTIDCRVVLQTDDGALIGMHYTGLRHGPDDVLQRLAAGEPVDPSEYYFRITPRFETAAPRYDWLNRIVAVGAGHRPPSGPVYRIWAAD